MTLVSAYLILDDTVLPDGARAYLHQLRADWEILSRRSGRQLVDAIAPEEAVPVILAATAALHPLVAGLWHDDGSPAHRTAYPFQEAALVSMMPDVPHGDSPISTRPVTPFEFHRWAGWAERVMA